MRITKYIPLLFGAIVLFAEKFGTLCSIDRGCSLFAFSNKIVFSVLQPAGTFALWFLAPAVLLVFVPKRALISWLRLAAWTLPVIIILLAFAPTDSHSWMPLYFISRDDFAKYFGILFAIISLILIGWKTFFPKAKS